MSLVRRPTEVTEPVWRVVKPQATDQSSFAYIETSMKLLALSLSMSWLIASAAGAEARADIVA